MRWVALLFGVIAGLAAWSAGNAGVPVRNPDAVAVIIGNKSYSSPEVPEVEFADRDAAAIKRYVIDVLGYDERNIIYVENATQGKLLSLFGSADNPQGELADWVREGRSDVFVYYSGHGVPGPNSEAFLLPVDADPATVELNGYKLSQLETNLESINARSVIVVLDACFSGISAGGNLIRDASVLTRPASPVPPGTGSLTWIAASGADQLANWDKADQHGLFTEYFLRAVYGAADDPRYGGHRDGKITLGAVHRYLDEEMSYVARREYRRPQKASVAGDSAVVLAVISARNPPIRPDQPSPAGAPAVPAPPPRNTSTNATSIAALAPAPPAPTSLPPRAAGQPSPAEIPTPGSVMLNDTLERLRLAEKERLARTARANLLQSRVPDSDITNKLPAEQLGAIGDNVRKCWTKDDEALDPDKMQVLLVVKTDAAGVVHEAAVAEQDRARLADPRFRAFAERAVRAVLDARCDALPLPKDKLGQVNEIMLRFGQ